jgi:hypothetical protein
MPTHVSQQCQAVGLSRVAPRHRVSRHAHDTLARTTRTPARINTHTPCPATGAQAEWDSMVLRFRKLRERLVAAQAPMALRCRVGVHLARAVSNALPLPLCVVFASPVCGGDDMPTDRMRATRAHAAHRCMSAPQTCVQQQATWRSCSSACSSW